MKKGKEFWAILIVLAAVVLIAGLSVARASVRGYAYNLFTADWGSRDISWGFSIGRKAELRNTIEIPTDQAESLYVEYGSENIYVYPADGDKIVIKEYLRSDKERDKATYYVENNCAYVTGGMVHNFYIFLFSFGNEEEHIDIYLPRQGMETLQLELSSGNISMERFNENYVCDSVSAETSSGNIKWNNTDAEEIKMRASSGNVNMENICGNASVHTSSGNIRIRELTGKADIKASSGDIAVDDFDGCGSLAATSGNVKAGMINITGDMEMSASSGNVSLEIPEDTAFTFEAQTSSGDIHTDFEEALSYNKKGNSVNGSVGSSPEYRIEMNATSGNVHAVYR